MTSGRGAKVPLLLQSVAAEYMEAGRAGRLANLDSIKEDDPRVLNNPWYNVAGTCRFISLLSNILPIKSPHRSARTNVANRRRGACQVRCLVSPPQLLAMSGRSHGLTSSQRGTKSTVAGR